MKISDIIVAQAIVAELTAKTRDEAIAELVESLAAVQAIPQQSVKDITRTVLFRESQATTGIGKGVALPHAKLRGINKSVACIGRSSEGLDFAALDSKPVYTVVLLLSNPDDPGEHLQAMGTIFKHVQHDAFRKFLRQSETKQAIIDLIQEADALSLENRQVTVTS